MATNRGNENLSTKFATMSEEERRRFALEQEEAGSSGELEFDDPRNEHSRTKADLEDRDGPAALLDDEQHEERVREEARARGKSKPGSS
jgi:hypothetical protein